MIMAMVSQETEKACENGAQIAIDPRESEPAFSLGTDMDDLGTRTYSIEKMKDGGISFHYTMEKNINTIMPSNTTDDYIVGEGSKFTSKLDYTLKGTEFQRLSELDYTKFDDSDAWKLFNNLEKTDDGSKQYAEHKLEKIVNSFSQEFKVNATCIMSINMTLMPSETDLIG